MFEFLWRNIIKPTLEWLISLLSRRLVAIIAIIVLIVGGVVYFFKNEPVLITSTYPYVTPNYPSEGMEELIPQQRNGKVSVLFQRIIWDMDHWKLAENVSNCIPDAGQFSACDETHAYQSWTIIVPHDNARLAGTSGTSGGQVGDIISLTHSMHVDSPTPEGLQDWYISAYRQPPGKVDVVIVRRDFYGVFQPIPKEKIRTWEPLIDTCEGSAAGIVVRNPTARAELIVHVPQKIGIRRDMYKVWRTRRIGSSYSTIEVQDQDQIGDISFRENTLHWRLGNPLLRDAEKENLVFHVSWNWAKRINAGPCVHVN